MRLYRREHDRPCRINIASLIDVVFLLIIFFMTVSQVSRSEAENLELPKAVQSQPDDKSQLKRLVVNVRQDGLIVMFDSELSLEAAEKLLVDEMTQYGRENIIVLIRADRQTDWQQVAAVMQICTNNGIARVRVAVIETTKPYSEL